MALGRTCWSPGGIEELDVIGSAGGAGESVVLVVSGIGVSADRAIVANAAEVSVAAV